MAKKRVKSKAIVSPVTDWTHADCYLRRISNLTAVIDLAKATATDDINEIKNQLENDSRPAQDKIDAYTASIEAFCASNKKTFGKKRSLKLTFGVVGWRKSSSISVKKTTLDLIKEFFGKKAAQYIHVKETPDKNALDKLTDEQLASVAARRRVKDDFFVECAEIETSDRVQ